MRSEKLFEQLRNSAFPSEDDVDVTLLKPGDPYPGPATTEGGSYTIRQKRGGVIERKVGRSLEFALGSRSTDDERGRNADEVLDAWRTLMIMGLTINVNAHDHVWYTEGGVRRFLAHIPGGFAWPTEEENEE